MPGPLNDPHDVWGKKSTCSCPCHADGSEDACNKCEWSPTNEIRLKREDFTPFEPADRASNLASMVCDSIWGGEHAWEYCTIEQFVSLKQAFRKRMAVCARVRRSWFLRWALGVPK